MNFQTVYYGYDGQANQAMPPVVFSRFDLKQSPPTSHVSLRRINATLRTPGNPFFPDNSCLAAAAWLRSLDRILNRAQPPFFDQEPRMVDGFQ